MNILISISQCWFTLTSLVAFIILYLSMYFISCLRYMGFSNKSLQEISITTSINLFRLIIKMNPQIKTCITNNVNLERVKNRKVAICANHRSFSDIMLFPIGLPTEFLNTSRTFCKGSLFNVPLLGSMLAYQGHFKVHFKANDTGSFSVDPVKQAQVADEIDQFLNANGSISLFPEGQVNKEKNLPLQTFRRGSFKLIIKHRLPIVYGVMVGADDLWPAQARIGGYPCCISIEYNMLEVDYEGRDKDITPEELSERMHNIMKNKYMDMVEARNKKCNA